MPGFILPYILDRRRLLPDEGVEDVGDAALGASAERTVQTWGHSPR